MKQKWYQIEIKTGPGFEEAIEFALNELNSLGNEINNLNKNHGEDISVIGYFNEPPDEISLREQIRKALRIYGFPPDAVRGIDTREIEDQDWMAEWKKHWKPTETDRFIIAPPWEQISGETEKIIIRIEPNMAFGTGTHETTRLCLRAIEKFYQSEMSFFDVGTGTGILAIAAAKYGRAAGRSPDSESQNPKVKIRNPKSHYVACDTDRDSVKIARENAELNEAGKISFYIGSISESSPQFDFVCANVTADVIIPRLPLLVEKAEKILVLSGILQEQKESVCRELEKFGIAEPLIETDGEWVSITVDFNDLN